MAKHLARLGVASRRAAEQLIFAGRVAVNGAIVTDPAYGVNDSFDIRVDGVPVGIRPEKSIYVMLHKPVGVLTTMSPSRESGSPLTDFVSLPERLHPIGRLDRDSSGLLLLTNDGDLTYRLTHPKYHIAKEYLVKLDRVVSVKDLDRLRRGVPIDGRAVDVDHIGYSRGGRLAVTIHEGRKRILRRLFGELGHRVLELKRIRVGTAVLGKLPVGLWRRLTIAEIAGLKAAAGNREADAGS